ncbi:MAG: hypothetical protein IJ576_04865 [Synergistaceae bacterium]|nr:hypothetical protein [Synergistaceae bacterium]MBR1603855.1 hypothetical protein [Synergistaceae bacterium]
MLKRSKVLAVLFVSVMLFTVAQPAFAWFDTDEQVQDAKDYAFWGAIAGGALAIMTGGLSLIPTAIAAGAGAAAAGAYGAANEEEKKELVQGAIIAGGMILDDALNNGKTAPAR